MTGNSFLEGEVRGGRCVLGQFARDNIMKNVGFIGPRPAQGSLFGSWGSPGSPAIDNQAVITNYDGNLGIDLPPHVPAPGTIRFSRLLDGWTQTKAGP